jgi:DNA sulfur modification protein DndB
MGGSQWLNEMSTDPAALKREAAKRMKSYDELSVAHSDVDLYVSQGWYIVEVMKRKTALRRLWSHDQALENRAWVLFYLLGYPQISAGRHFSVRIERKGADVLPKQIDVLAKDDETVVVTECKSCEEPTRRSLQKDIEEFANLKGPISRAIHEQYGDERKLKILWLFVTDNVIWSEPDKQRAKGEHIHVVTERELRYYLTIATHLHSAARFQFLAEFLKNSKIPEMENVRVPAVRGKLRGRPFYSFVSTPKQMLKIAFVNHRTLADPEGAPTYQRLVSGTRLRQISKFLHDGGYFPTNILVNFSEKCRFDVIATDDETNVTFGHLYLPSTYRSAWIIDGQHRLYGYAPLTDEEMSQNIMVVAFENLDKTEEANLFVTINHEQKSVPKNLLDELEGELKWNSERPSERIGAIASRLIGVLNNDLGEPMYGRVTQQGITGTDKVCLTVPELKAGLKRSGLLGTSVMQAKEYAPGPLSDLTDSKTLDRARSVINSYFGLVAAANPEVWNLGRPGLLCTNASLQAYLLLLGAVITFMEDKEHLAARQLQPLELVAEVRGYFEPVLLFLRQASPADMARDFKVPFGSGGPREYFWRLCRLVHDEWDDFQPEGLMKWIESKSEERVAEADRQIKELNILVQKYIFDTFKAEYGPDYWDRGVLDRTIKTEAYGRSLDAEVAKRLPLENYLEFIQYKTIVENKEHWPLFKPVFDIPEPGSKGIAKNLKWMVRINELRRVSAHATENRSYTVEDFEYIAHISSEFIRRLDAQRQSGLEVIAL